MDVGLLVTLCPISVFEKVLIFMVRFVSLTGTAYKIR